MNQWTRWFKKKYKQELGVEKLNNLIFLFESVQMLSFANSDTGIKKVCRTVMSLSH
jgi:hypothetical protein